VTDPVTPCDYWSFPENRNLQYLEKIEGGCVMLKHKFRPANKVLGDCPSGTVRLSDVLREMRKRVNGNPRCIQFFKKNFGIDPDDLFDSKKGPTIKVDPQLKKASGRTRCPSPSIRIQPDICQSPHLERVIMHELTHYAGCMTRSHTPSSEDLAKKGADICMGTVSEALEAARRRGRKPQTR